MPPVHCGSSPVAARISLDILGHAFVLDDVVLGQRFAPELRGEIGGAHHEKECEGRQSRQQF